MCSQLNPRLILHPDELDELRRRSESSHARFYEALVGDLERHTFMDEPSRLEVIDENGQSHIHVQKVHTPNVPRDYSNVEPEQDQGTSDV